MGPFVQDAYSEPDEYSQTDGDRGSSVPSAQAWDSSVPAGSKEPQHNLDVDKTISPCAWLCCLAKRRQMIAQLELQATAPQPISAGNSETMVAGNEAEARNPVEAQEVCFNSDKLAYAERRTLLGPQRK